MNEILQSSTQSGSLEFLNHRQKFPGNQWNGKPVKVDVKFFVDDSKEKKIDLSIKSHNRIVYFCKQNTHVSFKTKNQFFSTFIHNLNLISCLISDRYEQLIPKPLI